jgi:hypothetical protein
VRTGIDCSEVIYPQLADGIFSDNLAPTNKHECVQQLRQARQEVTKIVNKSYARREEEHYAKIMELEASAKSPGRSKKGKNYTRDQACKSNKKII